MASIRVEKFEKQMMRDLGEIFQQKSHTWFNGTFITVSRIQSSPDLGYIKCFVSILNNKPENESLQIIEDKSRDIRMELASRNKHLRKTPEISFFIDTSLEYVNKIETLLNSIKKEQSK